MAQKTVVAPDGVAVMVLSPSPRLDGTTTPQFCQQLKALSQSGHHHVVINLSQVEFMNSRGVATLLKSMRDLEHDQGSLRLCSPLSEVQRVFEVAMLDHILHLFATEDEAVQTLPRP